jgi:hypothetical protein
MRPPRALTTNYVGWASQPVRQNRDDLDCSSNYGRSWLGWINIALAVSVLVFISAFDAQSTFAQVDPTSLDPYGDSEQIRKDLDEILAQPEFRRLRTEPPQPTHSEMPEWLKKFLDWLGDLFRNAGSAFAGLGLLLQVLAYGLLAAICCLIIWLVVKAVNRYRERHNTGLRGRRNYEEGEAEIPPGDLPADEYLRRAAELAQKGLFREAIGQLILGAMSATERSGLIRFRRGLTHRDYLRALRGRTRPHDGLRTIVGVYEPICFGRRPAQSDHYRASLDGYETGFRLPIISEPTVRTNTTH